MSERVRIIAEAGVNHDGSLERALALVDIAAEAGADWVKFQTFVSSLGISRHTRKADYQVRNTGEAESQLEMVRKLELPFEAFEVLARRCEARGVRFLSTPFDLPSLAFLTDQLGLGTIKVPSGEVTNVPFLIACGQRARDEVILSTGMSSLGEVELALGALVYGALGAEYLPTQASLVDLLGTAEAQAWVRAKVTILHCTTEYPAPFDSIHLRAMPLLQQAFGTRVGLSDHSPGIHVPVAAVALGATLIEKHFTLDCSLPGPDHKASLDPASLGAMIRAIRDTEAALGTSRKGVTAAEFSNRTIARKVVVAARPVRAGERFDRESLTVKRAGRGMDPIALYALIGQPASRSYDDDEVIDEPVRVTA